MIDVKNDKLSLQVGDKMMEFCLPQSMAAPTPNDICCRVDSLKRELNQEAMTHHSMKDPLEAALIDCHVTNS